MDDWVREYRHELDEEGVDPDALLEETYRLAGQSRANAMRLFDRFLRDVARLDPPLTKPPTSRGGLRGVAGRRSRPTRRASSRASSTSTIRTSNAARASG